MADLRGYSKACGPAALAALVGVDRAEAARLLAELDPPRDRGWTKTSTVLAAIQQYGLQAEFVAPPHQHPFTLAQWTRERGQEGTWLVLVGKDRLAHFVVVRHGQVCEDNRVDSSRRRVYTAHRITDPNRPDYTDRPNWPSCRCGCGSTVHRDRYYRAGHDARHLSILLAAVRDGQLAVRAAMHQLSHSLPLQDKLASRLDRAGLPRAA